MRILRTASRGWILGPALAVYTAAWLAPATLWFQSRSITVSDSVVGQVPVVTEDRTIRWSFHGAYSVATWRVSDDAPADCAGSSLFNYKGGLDGYRTLDLVSMADNDPKCGHLPPGTYYLDVCRTVLRPLLGIIPSKTACWRSEPFIVLEAPKK